jgi:glutamyl-tRNA reductase
MNLLLVGLNHRTAPVAIRERYAVAPSEFGGLNEKLARSPHIDEVALISTCNRTELLAVSRAQESALECLHAFLRHELGDGSAGPSHIYELRDADVVMHLFRVAASLD